MKRDKLINKIQKHLVSRGFSDARRGSIGEVIADFILEGFVDKDSFTPIKNLKDNETDAKKIKAAFQESLDNANIELSAP